MLLLLHPLPEVYLEPQLPLLPAEVFLVHPHQHLLRGVFSEPRRLHLLREDYLEPRLLHLPPEDYLEPRLLRLLPEDCSELRPQRLEDCSEPRLRLQLLGVCLERRPLRLLVVCLVLLRRHLHLEQHRPHLHRPWRHERNLVRGAAAGVESNE